MLYLGFGRNRLLGQSRSLGICFDNIRARQLSYIRPVMQRGLRIPTPPLQHHMTSSSPDQVSLLHLSLHGNFTPLVHLTTRRHLTTSSTIDEKEIQKRLNEFQDLFVEARLCIEDVQESMGTKYFDEDAEAAGEAVQEAVDAFDALIADIDDLDEKNRVLRGNGLKVEQLKGELELALKGGHDH